MLPSYALGCLDLLQRTRVAMHLRRCRRCRDELQRYDDVTARLAASAPHIAAPGDFKLRLDSVPGRRRSGSGVSRFRIPAMIAPILLGILFLAALWYSFSVRRQYTELSADYAELERTVIRLSGTDRAPRAHGLLVISGDRYNATLVVDQMPSINTGRQFQLWLIRDEVRHNGGVFSVGPDTGFGTLSLQSSARRLDWYTSLGISVEPYGGSSEPTGYKVMGGQLTRR